MSLKITLPSDSQPTAYLPGFASNFLVQPGQQMKTGPSLVAILSERSTGLPMTGHSAVTSDEADSA